MQVKKNNYGSLISGLRADKNMNIEVLSNILLIPLDKMTNIEKGYENMSDSQLNICANIFNVSKNALENGKIEQRIKADGLVFDLEKFMASYEESLKSQSFMLEIIQELEPPERYKAEYSGIKEVYGYVVYDTKEEDFVRDEKGMPIMYDTAKDALEAAKKMDAEYIASKQNVTQSALKQQENRGFADITDNKAVENEYVEPDVDSKIIL